MSGPQEFWRPSASLWVIAMSVMLPTVMEVLDSTMANVALPHMAGALSASQDESTWVLTSYLVSNAIVLPMTGWISSRLGRKNFLMSCVVLFTLASAWCGAATSMPMLILARVVQGAAGGALQPLSQAILMESAPPEKRGATMAIFGMGVVVAPIIGPTLGGWITDNYSWRWMFFINFPVGILALFMCQTFIEDPPYLRVARGEGRKGSVDYIGFLFMALWLATLQIILDKGQRDDWFEATWIRYFAVISLVSMIAFVIWEFRARDPIVNLRILKNPNFAVGTAMMTLLGVVLYATVTLQPLFLQTLMGYTALDSGLALSPRGVGAIAALLFVGRIVGRIDNRILICFGFSVIGAVSFSFAGINLDITRADIGWPNVLMGFAMGCTFVPLTMSAMGGLSQQQMGNATGIFNLMRNIGGGIGISIVTTMLSRGAQTHQANLVRSLNETNPQFQHFMQGATAHFSQTMDPVQAKQTAVALLGATLDQQANLMAYIDNFRLLGILCLLCVPLALFLRRQRAVAKHVSMH